MYTLYIISREKNPHIPEVTSQVTKRLIGNIPLTNGFGCYKFIELSYIKLKKSPIYKFTVRLKTQTTNKASDLTDFRNLV